MSKMNRRAFVAAAMGSAAALPTVAQQVALPANVPTKATPRDWSGNTPVMYPDPDIVTLDQRRFSKYVLFNTVIQKLHTGTLWAEGPAWSGAGRFMVWSDIPNNVQLRWIADDNRVTVFHNPSGYSNGNTFDREGRQLSCEHGGRRIARYEINGTITAVAEKFENKRLNSPNDIVGASKRWEYLVHRSDVWHQWKLRRLSGDTRIEACSLSRGRAIGGDCESDR